MKNKTSKITITALFAAIITVMTAYVCHIPVGANGGYVHLGDAFIYVAAVFLPRPYAMAAAAIGGGMADLLTAPMWAPATIVIKMLIVLPFTSKDGRILNTRNRIAPWIAFVISATGYYLAEGILFGTFAAPLVSMAGSFVQSFGSAIAFYGVAVAFDKAGIKVKAESWVS